MRTVVKLVLILGLAMVTALPALVPRITVAQTSSARFRGTVTTDDRPAFEGMIILAEVNGNNCGSTNVQSGRYEIDVVSAEQKTGCGTAGATVSFVWGGLGSPGGTRATETGRWDNTRVNELNLTFTTEETPAGGWWDRPPGGSATEATCPRANQWLLLYWGGAAVPINEAAGACAAADRFWSNQGGRWLGFSPANPQASDVWSVQTGEAAFVHGAAAPTSGPPDVANATYIIDGQSITLRQGSAEQPSAVPGSTAPSITRLTDKQAVGDLNGDARPDVAVVLTYNPGGTGTFYNLVAVLNNGTATGQPTNAVFLGDRVVVDVVQIDGAVITVEYLTRREGEPMVMPPTVRVRKQFTVQDGTLREVV